VAGRPRTFDRDTALEQFLQLFWDNGFSKTSIDDLQAAAGIQRGSFYAAFRDKETAYLQCLNRYVEQFVMEVINILRAPSEPRLALAACLLLMGEFLSKNSNRGCFFLSTFTECSALSPDKAEALRCVHQILDQAVNDVCLQIEKLKQLNKNETATGLKAYMFTQILGARSGARPATIRQSADIAAAAIQSRRTPHG